MGKWNKTACFLLSAATSAMCLLPVLSGCSLFVPPKEEDPPVTGVEATVEEGKTTVRWEAQERAESYNIYVSDSLYGTYDLAGKAKADNTKMVFGNYPYAYYQVTAVIDGKEQPIADAVSVFGENTLVVTQHDDMEKVQAHIDRMHDELEMCSTGEFSDERFSVMFMPGTYDDLNMKIGFYTSVHGLGENPTDVKLNEIYVSSRLLSQSSNNGTHTFWRSVENVEILQDTRWAVSQATSLRRVQIDGNLTLHADNGWVSGGYLANSLVSGTVYSGSQQQWFSRNTEWNAWNGCSYNMVFTGCPKAPASTWSGNHFTTLERTERIAEKPFIYMDEIGDYNVFVPAYQEDTAGKTWGRGLQNESGEILSLSEFYIANPKKDTAESLNGALAKGKHILFTPGNYPLDRPLSVTKKDTVLLGMGYATLKISDKNGKSAINVADVDGVRIADVLLDAGAKSENVIVVGEEGKTASHAENPIVLSDVYIRVGNGEVRHTETEEAMVIYANDVIGDQFWIWRADHGGGKAWDDYVNEEGELKYGNPAKVGIRVKGNNVICYALMVEHFQGYQTLWEGEYGTTIMYQSETPYVLLNEDCWRTEDGKSGHASYKVADTVQNHRGYGLGVYLVMQNNFTVVLPSAIEVPDHEGIDMQHMVTTRFTANGDGTKISNVINDVGGAVGKNLSQARYVEKYSIK